ncbi:hypothetical protein EYE42_07270 [Paracoccus subflavus]|uniref:Post-segregation antitoxin CcdA n=1 Tax=Paracoccus subflavus TaxID=2528244 RepID=A0A4Q9G2V7_9RHOB|nr:type II toxin-antitoxin system CcdA family antitoxin [Paracoccus subflavus]TBN41171.1 hypothetical protein EYE42_07270 [Paracoccus subflavus]
MPQTATKTATNVTLSASLLAEARELHLNVSAIAEHALAAAVRDARAARWQKGNSEALAQRAVWIEENGMPLADIQTWRI